MQQYQRDIIPINYVLTHGTRFLELLPSTTDYKYSKLRCRICWHLHHLISPRGLEVFTRFRSIVTGHCENFYKQRYIFTSQIHLFQPSLMIYLGYFLSGIGHKKNSLLDEISDTLEIQRVRIKNKYLVRWVSYSIFLILFSFHITYP